jgi:hypothetical protein
MSKDYYIRISEEEYMDIPSQFRERATFIDNDYAKYKDNEVFKQLYSDYKKIKKKLEDWKYDQRHK